jgi:hypothetical protein
MARMSPDSPNATTIYQHATRQADRAIAAGVSAEFESARGGSGSTATRGEGTLMARRPTVACTNEESHRTTGALLGSHVFVTRNVNRSMVVQHPFPVREIGVRDLQRTLDQSLGLTARGRRCGPAVVE